MMISRYHNETPEHHFPLNEFLASLASDGIRLSVYDYDQLIVIFQTGGIRTVSRLKNVLIALLAKSEEQQEIISRRFDKSFAREIEADNKCLTHDIQKIINDLKIMVPESESDSEPDPEEIPGTSGTETPTDPTPKETETVCHDKPRKKIIPWILTGIILAAILIGAYFTFKIPASPPDTPKESVLELSHRVLDFGLQSLTSITEKELTLENKGTAPLTVEKILLKGEFPEPFAFPVTFPVTFPALNFPQSIPVNGKLMIPVSFVPGTEKTFIAELEIIHKGHKGENGSDTVVLRGTGKEQIEPDVRKRLYPNVPYVKSISQKPLERPTTWMKYAGISAFILFITLIYAFYLYRLKRGPQDKAPDYNEDAPGYFNPGTIGAKPLPRLDEETLGFLADSMGYFQSQRPGRMLNVPASISATLKQGGIPACVFYRRQQIRTLLILEDIYAEALDWNPIAEELADGMNRLGVPVLYGRFRGSPETFKTPNGSMYNLDDLEDHRRGILMLIFTDGKCFQRDENIFSLESIARWPMKAWMELKGQKFRDESASLPVRYNIPLYPATKDGIVQAVRRFLTEQGTQEKKADALIQNNRLPDLADTTLDVWIAHALGSALPWAQACAMIQPVTPGLADELRLRFHPHLDAEQIECLYALPNTTQTDSGLRFSDDVLKVLRGGFLTGRTDDEQKEVLKFILGRIEKARPNDAPENSLVYLSWEAVRERVCLELGDGDAQRFGELLQSPLGKSIGDSLENYGFSDDSDDSGKIPMRKPKSRTALQRMARLKDNPLGIGNFVSGFQRACLGILILCLFVSSGLAIKCLQDTFGPVPNLEIASSDTTSWDIISLEKTPALLEILENGTWKLEQELGEVGAFAKKPLSDGRRYRITLYGNGYRTDSEFETGIDQKTVLSLALKDVERKCLEEYPDIGLTVICCPEDISEQGKGPLQIATWKERLGDQAPPGRVMSVGLEFSGKDSDLSNFRNTLLKTGSVDVLYRVHPDQNGVWQTDQALSQFRVDLAQWMKGSQLVWWGLSGLSHKADFSKFGRALKFITEDTALKWAGNIEKLFMPGNDIVVNEREILQALGRKQTVGKGKPIALVRPLKTGMLIAETEPVSASISQEFSATEWKTLNFNGGTVAFYSPSGKYFAVLAHGDRLVLYDRMVNELAEIENLTNAGANWGNSLVFSPDEKYLAFSKKDKTNEVIITLLPKLEVLQIFSSHTDDVTSVSFSPDGKILASSSDDSTVKIWKLSSGKFTELQTLKGHFDRISSVFFNPDGKFLASGSFDKTIKIWKLSSGKFSELQSLKHYNYKFGPVSFSPDGKFLTSACSGRTVKIWKLSSGKFTELQTLNLNSATYSVSFSPDGKFLASGSGDDTVKIWELSSGKFIELQTLKGHSSGINSVTFSPDGKFLASGSHDKSVKIWKLTGVGGR
jgi:WD40 repeat protein